MRARVSVNEQRKTRDVLPYLKTLSANHLVARRIGAGPCRVSPLRLLDGTTTLVDRLNARTALNPDPLHRYTLNCSLDALRTWTRVGVDPLLFRVTAACGGGSAVGAKSCLSDITKCH